MERLAAILEDYRRHGDADTFRAQVVSWYCRATCEEIQQVSIALHAAMTVAIDLMPKPRARNGH